MDPSELPDLIKPVLIGQMDYAKGNRLDYENAKADIPRIRFFGNSILVSIDQNRFGVLDH